MEKQTAVSTSPAEPGPGTQADGGAWKRLWPLAVLAGLIALAGMVNQHESTN